MKLPFFKHGKERCNLKQIASFKKCCAFWPEYVLIFFESNSVPTLFLQKVPNKYYLFDINKKLKMVDFWGVVAIWSPPKDLQFWPTILKSCGLGWYMSAIPSNPCSPTTPIANSQKRRFWGASIYIYDILMYRENVLQLHWMMLIWKSSCDIFVMYIYSSLRDIIQKFKTLRTFVTLRLFKSTLW